MIEDSLFTQTIVNYNGYSEDTIYYVWYLQHMTRLMKISQPMYACHIYNEY